MERGLKKIAELWAIIKERSENERQDKWLRANVPWWQGWMEKGKKNRMEKTTQTWAERMIKMK